MRVFSEHKPATGSFLLWILLLMLCLFSCCGGQNSSSKSYQNVAKLFEEKFGANSGYNHAMRPLQDQGGKITVNVSFHIIAIVEIDAIKQRFIVNGFLGLYWTDELSGWDLEKYGVQLIHPYPNQIWRPRLILSNTLEARDLLKDDYSPVNLLFTGDAEWYPGSLFPTTCKLNLYKYPFDRQNCYIELYWMGLTDSQLKFLASTGEVDMTFYVESGEWAVEKTSIVPVPVTAAAGLAYFRINFTIKRLPGFFIINIVTPIVLMSFLNILVFLIPVDSGEKISYGITVLLALTVFMSIVSEQVPRSSDTIPLVTVYLLVLTILSVCTVIMSIIVVFFHHREEREDKRQKATSSFKDYFRKIKILNRATKQFVQVKPTGSRETVENGNNNFSSKAQEVLTAAKRMKEIQNPESPDREHAGDVEHNSCYVNRWRQIGKHLDCVSFLVFLTIWISVTIGFLVEIAT